MPGLLYGLTNEKHWKPEMPHWIICDCPSCGNTLRLGSDQSGHQTACPMCRALLVANERGPELPENPPPPQEDSTPQTHSSEPSSRPGLLVAKPAQGARLITAANEAPSPAPDAPAGGGPVLPEPVPSGMEVPGADDSGEPSGEPKRRKQKKRRFGFFGKEPDWDTQAPRSAAFSGLGKHLILVGCLLLLVGGGVLFFLMSQSTGRIAQPASGATPGPAAGTGIPEGSTSQPQAEPGTLSHRVIHQPSALLAEARPVAKEFLEAPDWQSRLKVSRNAPRIEDAMRRYYERVPYLPVKCLNIGGDGQIAYRDQMIVLSAVNTSYETIQIAMEYVDGKFLVDWESFVGYGELSPEEFRKSRTTHPVLMRVTLSQPKPPYFNYAFSDESRLDCFLITFPDQSYLYGYAERFTANWARLVEMLTSAPVGMATLRLRYPENATQADQVWIDSVVTDGWVVGQPGAAE